MDEKTVIQNIYGTVHGHVVGGNMHASSSPHQTLIANTEAIQTTRLTPQELRAQIRAARKQQASAWVRKYVNLPAIGMLGVLCYGALRLATQLSLLKQHGLMHSQSIQPEEAIVMGLVVLPLSYWLGTLRREHDMVIAYTQEEIDRAKLALSLRRD